MGKGAETGVTCGSLIDRLERINQEYQVFSDIMGVEELPPEGKFQFSVKDNICSKEMMTRAGSGILDGYRPPFDATSVTRLKEAGGILVAKDNMDEFGFGSFCINSAYGIPKNPYDKERCCGGSSGGSAAAACLMEGHLALGESTGGSISCPAAFCGVYGFTPTYGRVSRYGLVDYANSLDKIGIISRSARQVAEHLPTIAGSDQRDPTSCCQPDLEMGGTAERIAIPNEALDGLEHSILESFESTVERLASMGLEVEYVDMPSLRFALPAYYILASSESSTNLARYCGMRFGSPGRDYNLHFNDFFTEVRSREFGKEAKRRILLGTFSRMVGFRDRYYMKALQVRSLITEEYRRVFDDHDAVVTPTMPFIAPRFKDIAGMRPLDMYKADCLTVPANLCGLPHVSMPSDYLDGMPVGVQLVAPHWEEGRLIDVMTRWEDLFDPEWPEVVL
jgi:aspartyl-tRNA(Asn)/glutamyl-tRNA(Gln) amidotransferase subunit A